MNDTIVNIKTNKQLKRDASQLAEKMGLSLSGVVNAFLRHYVQTQELHITVAPRMTTYLEKIITEAGKEKTYGPFATGKEAVDFLKLKAWK